MPPPQDNARVFLIIIILLWLFSAPDNGSGLISTPALTSARLARQRQALGVLNSTEWGDLSPRLADDPADQEARYLNLTGFRQSDGYAWEDLQHFRERCLEWSRNANPASPDGTDPWDRAPVAPLWHNATGTVSGDWSRRAGSMSPPRTAGWYNLSEIAPHMNWAGSHHEWNRNVTGEFGKVTLRMDDKDDNVEYEDEQVGGDGLPRSGGLVREAAVTVTIQDEATGSSTWEMRLHGVHWPRQGAILVTTTSEKFAGIFGLPHLTPGADFFKSSQALLNGTLDKVLRKKERLRFLDPSNPWTSTIEGPNDNWNPSPHCEYVMYIQVHPIDYHQLKLNYYGEQDRARLAAFLTEIEKELRHPTGAPIKAFPPLQMSLVAWSPDCSFYLESKGPPLFSPAEGQHLVGMKEEILVHESKFWILAFAGVMFSQAQLMKGQMKESSTPSTLGRVSFYTAGAMLLADGLIFATATTLALSAFSVYLASLVLAFSAFISMLVGSVFMSDVYKIQEPERRLRSRAREQAASGNPSPPRQSATPTPPAQTSSATPTGDTLPAPVTAGPPRPPALPPIIIPSDQDIDAEIAENAAAGAAALPLPVTATTNATGTANGTGNGAANAVQPRPTPFSSITGRFILLGTFVFFLSVAAISWPRAIREWFINSLALIYLSMWVPQIWRNVQRNSRRAFAWRFMLGQSFLRLLPFAYFYLRPNNVIFARPDPRSFLGLAAWVWVQLWALAFQDVLGPRFLIPDSWTPPAWDYHPILREDNAEGGGLPIALLGGSSAPTSPVAEHHRTGSMYLGTGALGTGAGMDADPDAPGGSGTRKRERDKEREHKGTYVRSIDCAICRETLDVPVVRTHAEDPTGGGVAGLLQRRSYMVTPCRHIFHAACLEGWLRYRLQCPICREELPPL